MSISYLTNKCLPCDKLFTLFTAVGWSDGSKEITTEMAANSKKPLIHSTLMFLIGVRKMAKYVRELSDTMFRSVILDLAVLPEYQGRGIGSELARKCVKVFPDSEWSLETTPERVSFYERLGFEINNSIFLRIPCKWF